MAITLKKDAFVKNLIKGHKLAPYIDKSIGEGEFVWEAKFEPKQGDDAWHPSGDCTPTPYALYNKATTESSTQPSVGLRKAFTVGHFWHAYIQHIIVERLQFSTWDNIEKNGSYHWGDGPYRYARGSADIAPCTIPVHGDFLIDIKTQGSHDFKQQGLPAWCAAKYEAQLNIYMQWFDLERAIVLCVSKDSPHEFKEFSFVRNQPLIDAIYSKWKLVGDCIEAGVEPDQDYDPPLPVVGPAP